MSTYNLEGRCFFYMKYCSYCKTLKLKKLFSIDKHQKDGLQTKCKDCQKIMSKEHYKMNKPVYNINRKNYRTEYPIKYWVWSSISSHKRRGYIINISSKELERIANNTKICKYCGCELKYTYGERKTVKRNSPTLDRIDCEKEINKNNVQIICFKCNVTKQERSHKEFVEYCSNISNIFKK